MRVAIYAVDAGAGFGNKRARHIAKSFAEGLSRHGIPYVMCSRAEHVAADVAVAYGWIHQPVFDAYRAAGRQYVFWDLGYWGRRPQGAVEDGYHRVAVNDWDTAALMARDCPKDRFARLGLRVGDGSAEPRDVLVAGMSPKAAGTHGYQYGEWEARTCDALRQMHATVPLISRPKPNKRTTPQIPIEQALQTAKLLVTHHSNAAIDALLVGVPVYAVKGVGRLASRDVLDRDSIDNPYTLNRASRLQLLADVAYAQWTPEEMRIGKAWDHIKGLLS